MAVSKKKTVWIVIGVFFPLIAHFISQFSSDFSTQICAIGVLSGCLILWISEAMPMAVSTLLMICILQLTGLISFDEAIGNFSTNTALFIMASSGITVAIAMSNIPKRLTSIVMMKTIGHSKFFIFSLGFFVTFFSAFMSSLAACTLFTGIIEPVLKHNGLEPGKSNFGKAVMLVIPACAGIGGFITPAGTPANILVLQILSEHGHNISFFQWSLVGFPLGILATGLFLINLLLLIKPEEFSTIYNDYKESLTKRDWNILIITVGIIVGWFAGSFYTGLSTTFVAVIGLIVMFIPSLNILNFKDFSNRVNWDLILTMGSVTVIMTAVSNSGLISDIASVALSKIYMYPPCVMLMLISATLCVFRAFIPTTTAVIALFAPMLISISYIGNMDIVTLMMLLAFWAATALLLVYTEPIYLVTYKSNFYKESDLLKIGILPSMLLSVLICIMLPMFVSFLHL